MYHACTRAPRAIKRCVRSSFWCPRRIPRRIRLPIPKRHNSPLCADRHLDRTRASTGFFSLTLSPVLLFAPAKILHLNRQNRSSEATKNVSKISPHSVCEISLRLSECMWVSTGHGLPATTKPAPKRTSKTDRRHKRTPRPPNHRKSKSPIQPPLV